MSVSWGGLEETCWEGNPRTGQPERRCWRKINEGTGGWREGYWEWDPELLLSKGVGFPLPWLEPIPRGWVGGGAQKIPESPDQGVSGRGKAWGIGRQGAWFRGRSLEVSKGYARPRWSSAKSFLQSRLTNPWASLIFHTRQIKREPAYKVADKIWIYIKSCSY